MTIEEMKRRKLELGFSNQQLADEAGIPLGTLQKLFAGQTKAPRRKTVLALERVLTPERSGSTKAVNITDIPLRGTLAASADSLYLHADRFGEPLIAYQVSPPQGQPGEHTISDYYALPEERRVELIDGIFYDMASPSMIHQTILGELLAQLRDFIRKNHGSCRVLPAPFDVQLDMDDRTMVQPDIAVICDKNRWNKKGGYGAPDMVIEILSPSTRRKDLYTKLYKYSNAGVKEYWIVDPDNLEVIVHHDLLAAMAPKVYTFQDQVPVRIWDDQCLIDFPTVYEEIRELR